MEVIKYIERKIQTSVFFFETKLDIAKDKNYLIAKIEEGIKSNTNNNYTTNVKGKMTDWKYFVNDQIFFKYLVQGSQIIKDFFDISFSKMPEAWGIKMIELDYTARHNHANNNYSGILYLNDTETLTSFYQLNLSIKPKEGTFLLFSGLLDHGTERHIGNIPKYAIPFNFNVVNNWNS